MLSVYAPERHKLVYCTQCWYSDKWSPLDFGAEYDFSKPFFVQFKELLKRAPLPNLSLTNITESDYCNYSLDLKNCYLLFGSWSCEDSMYCERVVRCTNACDSMWLTQGDFMYDATYCTQSQNLMSAFDAHTSRDSALLAHCREVSRCFGCINLRNQSYFIFNEPHTKESYAEKVKLWDTGSYATYQDAKKKFEELSRRSIHPATINKQTANSSGDMLRSCKNCTQCFLSSEGEDSAYCVLMEKNFKDCRDIWIAMENTELCYEIIAAGANNQGSKFGVTLYQGCSRLEYCYTCVGAHDSFGCVGLKQNNYCILNKEYSKEEYNKLIGKIREQMSILPYKDKRNIECLYGEFFPAETSPFAYNESLAQEWFPLTKEGALTQGYGWKEPETRSYKITKQPADLPDNIKDAPDSITQEVVACAHREKGNEQCTSAFRIIPAELQRRKCLCEGANSAGRIAYRNTAAHFHDDAPCPNEFETTFAPDPRYAEGSGEARRREIVYCEQCYNAETA